ncbi:MAG: serine hydrolase domain-containing protein [Panacagrimonas sp.]
MNKRRAIPALKPCVLSLLSGLCLVACGGGGGGGDDDDPVDTVAPVISVFSATPGAVAAGGESELSWNVSDADTVTIDPLPGRVASSGTQVLRPLVDTSFTITATNEAGTSMQNLSIATLTYDWTALDRVFESRVPSTIEGYVFKLMIDGVPVFRRAGGRLAEDSRVFIASASKALASMALLTLVRDGALDLDRPIAEYLGEDWPDDKVDVTTRMLLNHTSGLAIDDPCLDNPLVSLETCAMTIAAKPLQFPPGSAFTYGANSYQVAGWVAERLSGQPFAEFFQRAVAEPLGMANTVFEDRNPRLAGGAQSNADDYLRFTRMILLDGRGPQRQAFLPPDLVATLRESQIDGLRRIELPPGANANFNGYSLGWWLSRPGQLGGLSQGPEISDPGVFGTVPWIDFDRRYSAVLLLLESEATVGIALWDDLRVPILEQLAAQP